MRYIPAPMIVAVLTGALAGGAAAVEIESTRIVPSEQLSRRVLVQEVQSTPDVVTGTVVNATPEPVRDVRLLVRDDWLWRNERHPGDDNPGRAATVTVREEIPPGSRVRFTYRRDSPLPGRTDGRFETAVDVLGFTTLETQDTSQR